LRLFLKDCNVFDKEALIVFGSFLIRRVLFFKKQFIFRMVVRLSFFAAFIVFGISAVYFFIPLLYDIAPRIAISIY